MSALRVLVVEDDPADVVLLRAALERAPGPPFVLERVDRVSAAVERLEKGGVDAVLLDLSLPDSLGLSTVDRLRAAARSTAIVVLSAFADEEAALEAHRHGVEDYLVKGRVEPAALARAVRHAVERKAIERLKEEAYHDVNHDLRSPLASVNVALELLLSGTMGELGERQRATLELVARGVRQIAAMTDDLAAVFASERGRLEVRPSAVSLAEAVEETVGLKRLSKRGQGRTLAVALPAELPAVLADPVRLRQVLGNLLDNVLWRVPAGGTVEVSAAPEGTAVRVSVSGPGPGLSAEEAERAFERESDIGLYLCRLLVAAQGGEIRAEGAAFRFTLPRAG